METVYVVEMFCKMGLHQLLSGDPQCVSQINTSHLTMCVVCVYRVMGIITKKNMLKHVAEPVE